MVCTSVTVSAVTPPNISVSGLGFDISACTFNLSQVTVPVLIAGNVTANVKCKADVTLSWKIDGVSKNVVLTQMLFSQGTQLWSLNTGNNWQVGTYTAANMTFSNIVAV